MQFGEKSRSVYTRLKALKELFSLIAFIRVLMVVNVVETSSFDILIFDAIHFRLLILLKISGVFPFRIEVLPGIFFDGRGARDYPMACAGTLLLSGEQGRFSTKVHHLRSFLTSKKRNLRSFLTFKKRNLRSF